MPTINLSVADLAEFVHRSGDLFEPGGRVRAEEGTAVHSAIQKERRSLGWESEVAVKRELQVSGWDITLRGRADLVHYDNSIVEELKTTRVPVTEPRSEHVAQACLYAALLDPTCAGAGMWSVRVSYVHPDTRETTVFEETHTGAALEDFLERTLEGYGQWVQAFADHRREVASWLEDLRFPYPAPRPYQRAIVERCAEAMRENQSLLLEAPTGSGKSLGVLYPAVRQLPHRSRILFLTSRTTGAAAARDALRLLDDTPRQLRTVSLTARERICPVPGQPCDPNLCTYAAGYYDRRGNAVRELLEHADMEKETVSAVAETHEVCPFELSLDAAVWADVIIGDYNYVFDPVVRLQRFADDPNAVVLVDEAHQLAPRAAEMLSFEISRGVLQDARTELPSAVLREYRRLDRMLTELRREWPACRDAPQMIDVPERLIEAARSLTQAAQGWLADHPGQRFTDAVQALVFMCARLVRGAGWMQEADFVVTLEATGRTEIIVRFLCIDAAPYIAATLDRYGANIRFSATVSPAPIYQAAHGDPDGEFARAGSTFSTSQLATLVVPDIPTYYRERAASLPALVQLVEHVCRSQAGRYLLCFPSYAYLQSFVEAAGDPTGYRLMAQAPAMDEHERAVFLAELGSAAGTLVAAVVLGGVFTESVDLHDSPLTGVIIVGVAIPPPGLVRQATVAHHDTAGRDGRLVAFVQPGMAKVVQAAGRLIRAPDHRGVLVLVDTRYQQSTYRQFFPSLWQPQVTGRRELPARLHEFWVE